MSASNRDCLRCHATMQQGFKGHDVRRLTTFPCHQCGYVEFRALASE